MTVLRWKRPWLNIDKRMLNSKNNASMVTEISCDEISEQYQGNEELTVLNTN